MAVFNVAGNLKCERCIWSVKQLNTWHWMLLRHDIEWWRCEHLLLSWIIWQTSQSLLIKSEDCSWCIWVVRWRTRSQREQRSEYNIFPPILKSLSTTADDDTMPRYIIASFPKVGCDSWWILHRTARCWQIVFGLCSHGGCVYTRDWWSIVHQTKQSFLLAMRVLRWPHSSFVLHIRDMQGTTLQQWTFRRIFHRVGGTSLEFGSRIEVRMGHCPHKLKANKSPQTS